MHGLGWFGVVWSIIVVLAGICLLIYLVSELVAWLGRDKYDEQHRIEVERKLTEMRIDQLKQEVINQLFEQARSAQQHRPPDDDLPHHRQ